MVPSHGTQLVAELLETCRLAGHRSPTPFPTQHFTGTRAKVLRWRMRRPATLRAKTVWARGRSGSPECRSAPVMRIRFDPAQPGRPVELWHDGRKVGVAKKVDFRPETRRTLSRLRRRANSEPLPARRRPLSSPCAEHAREGICPSAGSAPALRSRVAPRPEQPAPRSFLRHSRGRSCTR